MEYMAAQMDRLIEGAQETYASMCFEIDQLKSKCNEHRDGRLAALERVSDLERRLQEIGDLAASSLTGPAQIESLKMIEIMCFLTPKAPHPAMPAE